MMPSPVPAVRFAWTAAGFTVWGLALVVLYAALSLGCVYGWHLIELPGGVTFQRALLVALLALSLAAAALVVWLTWHRWRATQSEAHPPRPARFLDQVSYLAALAALGISVVTFGPVFFLTTCS